MDKKENESLSSRELETLKKIKKTQMDDYLKGTVSGSVTASDRLMKELKDVYQSAAYKNGTYTLELVNDSLYEWNVKILRVDPDSHLCSDLKKLKKKLKYSHILLNFTFKDSYPLHPPFVRVVEPIVTGGYVMTGGAICMELLTPQGWSSVYTVDAIIIQIAATLVQGKARIDFSAPANSYSYFRAQSSFQSMVKLHGKNGWYTPPKSEG
ncbi:uncharacterized protein TRIADDRAFT_21996 [Trichoplax adhaerens]|uniref:UBC core domain-containing protein n=1 Tax=Trichoplax adhaerens TaxID=10228 RepID=B3RR56_TRIAD|nr:hypothetical protein TRIADDRAFT_21996 [Trichoplax adhaerens]EDV26819.1 hypothetical protein TRIADDRAFT_21996 [Trichoplax adhaerens]|eukprot:XP_002110815.1 hypothetical protein TRIADDRAFT_21996 [Trichoplax adhaerens]